MDIKNRHKQLQKNRIRISEKQKQIQDSALEVEIKPRKEEKELLKQIEIILEH